MQDWIGTDWQAIVRTLVSAIGVLAGVILCIRLNGLRSSSKMSSFDFAVTVGIGSIVGATVMSDSPSIINGALAVGALPLTQRLVAVARCRLDASNWVDNQPVILMRGTAINTKAMSDARLTESDLYAKLREANVLRLEDVGAVVRESTGDISVLHDSDGKAIDSIILSGVRTP